MTHRIAILTSGLSRGSNFEAMMEWFQDHRCPVTAAFLVVTRADAPVIERAQRWGVPVLVQPWDCGVDFESAVLERIRAEGISLVALAGFMKLLSRDFLERAGCPVLNIHPALLPLHGGRGMYGINVHRAVFAAHDEFSGVTVHQVSDRYDEGAVIAQERVCVADCRSPEEIAMRVLKIEHRLYGETIWNLLKEAN